MRYLDSVQDFFKHPKWMMNLLLGGVCMFIPLVGTIVLSGWIITQLWAQGDEKDPAKFPEFDFNHFVKYLNRGLWPFLVQLVAGLAVGIVVAIVIVIAAIAIAAISAAAGKVGAILAPLMLLVGLLFYVVVILGLNFVLVPLSLKATLTQDFGPAFDLAFIKSFITKTWKEMILSALFMFAVGIGLIIVAIITLGLGLYFAMPAVVFSWQHLMKQLYGLYLERGGTEVAKSDKLIDTPPALPAAEI